MGRLAVSMVGLGLPAAGAKDEIRVCDVASDIADIL